MDNNLKVPSPQELMQENPMTPGAIAITNAMIEILREKYVGKSFTIKLKDIRARIRGLSDAKIQNEDWDKMELMLMKAGWSIQYDGPGYCESYDAYYEIKAKNK